MFRASDLVALTYLFLAAETTAGQILPPQNLSLQWFTDFEAEISWDPPPHSVAGCHYDISVYIKEERRISQDPPHTSYKCEVWMDGGFLGYSLKTVCGSNESKPAVLNINDPELVKDVDCYVINSTQGHCSWSPVYDATDLRFFYQLQTHDSDDPATELRECSSYSTTGGVRSGCDLPATPQTFIGMVFKATLNNTLVRNTFKEDNFKLKPPPLKWEVKKSKDKFNITWSPPDMRFDSWTFRLNYTSCDLKRVRN
ncbi:interleukin-13 receptor subunit alpha-1 [Fundulus heteroclitus]|uniref:interleukin-13 receptor subunit alpha-1 n=1 Tax=Fundulus heteroclitus TaxID=8078 RepID=UPI00165C5F53|nr:interleukin-13 receptor subunit alpha-1 [Fundulus heteroclitus]